MSDAEEYYRLRSGRTIQILHHDGMFWTCLFDITGLEPRILEVYSFHYLHEASQKATSLVQDDNRRYLRHPFEEQIVSRLMKLENRS